MHAADYNARISTLRARARKKPKKQNKDADRVSPVRVFALMFRTRCPTH